MQEQLTLGDMIQTAAKAAEDVRCGAMPVSVANATARNLEVGMEFIKAEILRQRISIDQRVDMAQIGISQIR